MSEGWEPSRSCEAGAVTHRGRNERETGSQSTEQGISAPTTTVCGERGEKQLTEAERSSEFFIRRSISNLPELTKLRDTAGIYFKKKD